MMMPNERKLTMKSLNSIKFDPHQRPQCLNSSSIC